MGWERTGRARKAADCVFPLLPPASSTKSRRKLIECNTVLGNPLKDGVRSQEQAPIGVSESASPLELCCQGARTELQGTLSQWRDSRPYAPIRSQSILGNLQSLWAWFSSLWRTTCSPWWKNAIETLRGPSQNFLALTQIFLCSLYS